MRFKTPEGNEVETGPDTAAQRRARAEEWSRKQAEKLAAGLQGLADGGEEDLVVSLSEGEINRPEAHFERMMRPRFQAALQESLNTHAALQAKLDAQAGKPVAYRQPGHFLDAGDDDGSPY